MSAHDDSVRLPAELWAAESPFVGEAAEEEQAQIHPWYEGYTPFVEGLEEMYAPEAGWESDLVALEAESPLQSAFDQDRTSLIEPGELEVLGRESEQETEEEGKFERDTPRDPPPPKCGFHGPNSVFVTEVDLRSAVANVALDERKKWWGGTSGTAQKEDNPTRFGDLVRYWLAGLFHTPLGRDRKPLKDRDGKQVREPIHPGKLEAVQQAALDPSITYPNLGDARLNGAIQAFGVAEKKVNDWSAEVYKRSAAEDLARAKFTTADAALKTADQMRKAADAAVKAAEAHVRDASGQSRSAVQAALDKERAALGAATTARSVAKQDRDAKKKDLDAATRARKDARRQYDEARTARKPLENPASDWKLADRQKIRKALLAKAAGTDPQNIDDIVDQALLAAHRSRADVEAWSAVFVVSCVRTAAIGRKLEAMDTSGAHVGKHGLLRASRNHAGYVVEARERKRKAVGGTYHAFEPGDPEVKEVKIGDIICTDRTPFIPKPVALKDLESEWILHCDIVTSIEAENGKPFAVTIGGNVGHTVRRRRYPLDSQRRLVVSAGQLFAQEEDDGTFLPFETLNPVPTTMLGVKSTGRILALLRLVVECKKPSPTGKDAPTGKGERFLNLSIESLESPFLDEELLPTERRNEFDSSIERLADESPFVGALEEHRSRFDEDQLEEEEAPDGLEGGEELEAEEVWEGLEEGFVEEDESAWEWDESLEYEAYDEVAADLEGGIEGLYPEEAWIEPEELAPGEESITQRVKRLIDGGVFGLSLLGRFNSGQIWNEDYLALEILFHRQPGLRPAKLDTVSGSGRLGLLYSLAVKHQRDLTPIRERMVRPTFGNPANFQVGPAEGCQIQDLREEVRKLGPLYAGTYNGKPYYKRAAHASPRKEAAIDSIVLHHMAFNRGNDVNSYIKVGAHYIVTADGQVAQLYDDLDFLNASDGFNPRSVAIEFAGNFSDYRYYWWWKEPDKPPKPGQRLIPDRCYLTPAQIRAGRCLLATLTKRLPGIKYLYAHRQSSKDRPADPGPDMWFNIGEWGLANLNLTDRLPRTHIGTGQPIPDNWRMSRTAIPATSVTPTTPSAPSTARPAAELVRFAQRVLNAAEGERLDVDGDPGPLTRGALERFRGKYNLGAGGVLDGKTQLALAQRALEEIARQSIFAQPGVLDAKTEQALITFKSGRGLGFGATLDSATRVALADALAKRVSVPSALRPVAETEWETELAALEMESPFQSAFEQGRTTLSELEELEEGFVEEDESAWEWDESLEYEAYDEVAADLEGGIEELYPEEAWIEPEEEEVDWETSVSEQSPAIPAGVAEFAVTLGKEWAKRRNGSPSAEKITGWLLQDYQDTLEGARHRFKKYPGDDSIGRGWMISRQDQMKFQTSAGVKALLNFQPPTDPVALVSNTSLIQGSDKAPVAPVMVRFVEELRQRYRGSLNVSTYRGHGGGKFEDRGYSLDLFLQGRDGRGFYPPEEAVKFLRALREAARAINTEWRVIYNDFSVADTINRETGQEHVIFVGKARQDRNKKVTGLNWHGPHPLILHFHLDLVPGASTPDARVSEPSASTTTPTSKPIPGTARPPAELVRFAQRVLNTAEGERLDVDGDPGPLTRGALERFRGKYNLGAGGVLDGKTQLALAQRALEEIARQSIFAQPGVLDAKTEQALITFKSGRGLGFGATLDSATRVALADALAKRVSVPSALRPVTTPSGLPKPGAGLTPPPDPAAYRKFRLTTYHVVDQAELPMGAVRVPIYDDNGRRIAEGSPAFFAQLSLEGTARLTDGRLINVTGKTVPVSHDEYAGVLAYHLQAYAKSDEKRREEGRKPTPTAYSGIVVENDRVVRASAFHEVPASRRGIGYGSQRGIPYVPFRTLAADIGHVKYQVEPKWKGKGGLVPPGTHVYIKEYDGLRLPDGTTHDGWFVVNDTGGAIFGAHFDVFVGTRALRKQIKLPEFGQVWFAGIEQRIPPGYTYGLKA